MCVCNSNLTAGESNGALNSAAYLTFFLFLFSRSISFATATSLQINNRCVGFSRLKNTSTEEEESGESGLLGERDIRVYK